MTAGSVHADRWRSEGCTMYCSASGDSALSGSVKVFGLGTSCGHASTATERLRSNAAKSGISCCHAYSADSQLAPPAGQHSTPARSICT